MSKSYWEGNWGERIELSLSNVSEVSLSWVFRICNFVIQNLHVRKKYDFKNLKKQP